VTTAPTGQQRQPTPRGTTSPSGVVTAGLADRLVELRRELRRAVRAGTAAGPVLLPVAQVEVLQAVAELVAAAGPPRVRDVAATLSLADNTVSGLVAELVRQGLLARSVDPSDERAAHLTLTGPGDRRLREWAHAHSDVLLAGLAALGAEADLRDATDAVDQLVLILRAARGRPCSPQGPLPTART
jgi:DNA-binding MarR family transcriptional regulator